tara:strand:+ start:515 stop:2758 length:2244 start_codon:yes stop_codon:yes gene_type:complete
MSILLKLFHISFYPSFFLVLCTANWAYASSSIEGKKLILDATGFGKSEPFIKTFYFLPNNSVTDDEWEHGAYTWIESGATGTVVLEDDGNEKFELVLNLSNNTFQGISTEGGQSTVAGSGTYSLSDYASGEIPYNQFFSDDFSSVTYSSSIWGSYSEYGLSAGLYNNAYGLFGTLNDSDERWSHEIGAKSLLSLTSDWVVQGSAFSQSGETIEVSIECQENRIGFQLEVHVGTTGSTVISSIQYERFDNGGSWQSLYNSAYSSNNFGGNNATFRIRNSAGEKSFHIEWLDGSAWRNLNSLNWETGTLSKNADYGSYQSSNQLNDWESMESYYFNPQMEFGVPESLTVNPGDYGFTSFSVTSDEDPMPKAFEDLSSEVSRVNALIAQSASDPEANLLRGLYALLEFVELDQSSDNSLKDFAVSLGVEESIRNFVLSDVSTLENYNFDLSDSFQAKELAELFEYSLIPALETADAYFSKIGSNQTITLSSEITGSDESITVDSADVYVLRSIVNILGGLASLQAAFDWNLNSGEIEALDNDPSSEVTAEKIRDLNSNFGGIRSASLLTKSKDFLKTAVETYDLASPLLRASSRLGTEDRLFSLASEDLSEESDFKEDLDELYLALDSSHNLKEDGSSTDTLSLSNLFAGQVDIPTLLPELVGDQFETDQVSDPTLGGLFPNWDQARISALMLDAELSIPQPTGWMWFDSYPWVYSHEENSWIYLMPYNSKLLYFSVKHNAWLEMSATSN